MRRVRIALLMTAFAIPAFAQSTPPWVHIAVADNPRITAGLEIARAEPYAGGPWAAVPAAAMSGARSSAAQFRVRAWREGNLARVVVYAVLPDPADPKGAAQKGPEVQIWTSTLRPSESVVVAETERFGAAHVRVTMGEVR